jgi:hypothetical protein
MDLVTLLIVIALVVGIVGALIERSLAAAAVVILAIALLVHRL